MSIHSELLDSTNFPSINSLVVGCAREREANCRELNSHKHFTVTLTGWFGISRNQFEIARTKNKSMNKMKKTDDLDE